MKDLNQYILEKLHPSKFKKEKEIYFKYFDEFVDKFKNEETDFGKPIKYEKDNIEVGKCYIMSENDIRWNGCDFTGGFYIILGKIKRNNYNKNGYYILQLVTTFTDEDLPETDTLTIDFCEWNSSTKDVDIQSSAFIKEPDGGGYLPKIPYSSILKLINSGLKDLHEYDDIEKYMRKFEKYK